MTQDFPPLVPAPDDDIDGVRHWTVASRTNPRRWYEVRAMPQPEGPPGTSCRCPGNHAPCWHRKVAAELQKERVA